MEKELRVVKAPVQYFDDIEAILNAAFRKYIFIPLMRELNMTPQQLRLDNNKPLDREVLLDAIKRGDVYFERGYFKGKFSAAISREMIRLGGKFDGSKSAWRVDKVKIPYPIADALVNADQAFTRVVANLENRMAKLMSAKFADQIPLSKILEKMVYKVDQDVRDTIKSVSIEPKITPEEVTELVDPYVGEVRASIKGWTEDKMLDLRKKVQESVTSGQRYEGLVKVIEDGYEVSQGKAKFLARQETNLMTERLKEQRYKAAGITKYRWRCVVGSPAHPVRPMHKALDNKVFSFDNPPIVDKNGNRKNPSQDYNCRCVAVPIVEFDK